MKETEKSLLARALRNNRVMCGVVKDAFESGNLHRAEAGLELMDEFVKDVKAVLVPIIEAARIAKETGATQPSSIA